MKRFKSFIIFSVIGVLCVLIDYSIYIFLFNVTDLILIPKILSSIASVSVNYFLNSKLNFDNQKKINIKFYSQYLIIYAFLIALNAVFNSLFIKLTGEVKLSFWLAAIIAAFTNYFTVKAYFSRINKNKNPILKKIT